MLKNILNEINKASIYSIAQISRNLDITENMVEELVSQLVRMGYLTEDLGSPTCQTKCSGCSFSSMCNTVPIKMLSVSSKGKQLLNV